MRPSIQETMLRVACVLAERATCAKKKCGCVMTDAKGRILAATYNGPPRGEPHCNETGPYSRGPGYATEQILLHPCAGYGAPSGSDLCEGVHAEQNALMRCKDVDDIRTVYLTHAPCWRCVKEMMNTGATAIYFLEPYKDEPQALALWSRSGRAWTHYMRTWP